MRESANNYACHLLSKCLGESVRQKAFCPYNVNIMPCWTCLFKGTTSSLPSDNIVLNISHWVHLMLQQRKSNLFQSWGKGKQNTSIGLIERQAIHTEYSGTFMGNFVLHPDFRVWMCISTVMAHKQWLLKFLWIISLTDSLTKI